MKIRDYLTEKMEERKIRNPRYSLRAFAKDLKISPSHLSEILNQKKSITKIVGLKILRNLNTDPMVISVLLSENIKNEINILPEEMNQKQFLSESEFEMISKWYYFAILGLAHLKTNKSNAKWVAEKLKIPMLDAWAAFKRLQALGYIKVEKNKFVQTTKPLITTTDIPSAVIKENHISHMKIAIEKIHEVDVDLREFTNITFATNPKMIKSAKLLIREFRDKLAVLLDSSENESVYNLSIQFFPLIRS